MDIEKLVEMQKELNAAKEQLASIMGGDVVNVTHTQENDADIWSVGENYLIRTVTHIQTGRLVKVGKTELVLEDAAWIADTGRFANALVSCDFNEVEPFPSGVKVIVGRGAITDALIIEKLPTTQK